MFQTIRQLHRDIDAEERAIESTSSSAKDDELEIDSVLFEKYRICGLLGVGGFAKVYEATNVVSNQSVAIKVVSKAYIKERGLTAQVHLEIAIMRRLNHPNIVKLHEVMATKTKIFLVMELAKGGELHERIVGNQVHFDEDQNRRWFQQLISAVEHCHSQGIYHRDLKLDNLLLGEDLNIKVSDFGLSTTMGMTRPDGKLYTICGTPAYLSPEMIGGKGYYGDKVDVWQCGVVLYVLTFLSLPFGGPDVQAQLRRIRRGEVRIPRWAKPDLRNLLKRLLDPNPNTRITIDEIKEDPWFKKGYREIKVCHEKNVEWEEEDRPKSLNAFHLISLSPGLDMSGMFGSDPDPEFSGRVERVISKEAPERIVEVVEAVADRNIVKVARKKDGCGVKIEGQSGNFVVWICVNRLTDKLVMVEVKMKEKGDGVGAQFWKDTLWPRILELEYKPQ